MYLPLSICATKAHVYEMNWLWSSLGNHFSGNNNVIVLTGGRNPRIYEMNGVLFTSLSEDSRLLFRKWQQANVPSTVVAVQTEPKSSGKDGNRLSVWYSARRRKLLKNGNNYHNKSAFISADKFFFLSFWSLRGNSHHVNVCILHAYTNKDPNTDSTVPFSKMTCFLLPQWH